MRAGAKSLNVSAYAQKHQEQTSTPLSGCTHTAKKRSRTAWGGAKTSLHSTPGRSTESVSSENVPVISYLRCPPPAAPPAWIRRPQINPLVHVVVRTKAVHTS